MKSCYRKVMDYFYFKTLITSKAVILDKVRVLLVYFNYFKDVRSKQGNKKTPAIKRKFYYYFKTLITSKAVIIDKVRVLLYGIFG
jgi:hypothetical protein